MEFIGFILVMCLAGIVLIGAAVGVHLYRQKQKYLFTDPSRDRVYRSSKLRKGSSGEHHHHHHHHHHHESSSEEPSDGGAA